MPQVIPAVWANPICVLGRLQNQMVKEMLCPGLQVLSPEPPTGLGWSQRTLPLTQPQFQIPWTLSVLGRFHLEVPCAVFQYKRKLFFYEEAVRVSVMPWCEGRWTKKLCLFPRKPHIHVAQFYYYYYFGKLGKLSCPWMGRGFVAPFYVTWMFFFLLLFQASSFWR